MALVSFHQLVQLVDALGFNEVFDVFHSFDLDAISQVNLLSGKHQGVAVVFLVPVFANKVKYQIEVEVVVVLVLVFIVRAMVVVLFFMRLVP